MNNDLLDQLTCELGEIYLWEEQCPGVYYLSVLPTIGRGGEYYAVLADAPVSQEARAMGQQLERCPALVYLLEGEDGAWAAVEYEMLRYQTQHGLPLPEGRSLRETALYGMELCPEYFGTYPVPPLTPWGYTLRHRSLDNGGILDGNGSMHGGIGGLPPSVGFRAAGGVVGYCQKAEP